MKHLARKADAWIVQAGTIATRGSHGAHAMRRAAGSTWKKGNVRWKHSMKSSGVQVVASLGTRSRALIMPGGMGFPFWGSGAMSEKSASILAKLPPICVQTTVTRALVSMWLEPSAELVQQAVCASELSRLPPQSLIPRCLFTGVK